MAESRQGCRRYKRGPTAETPQLGRGGVVNRDIVPQRYGETILSCQTRNCASSREWKRSSVVSFQLTVRKERIRRTAGQCTIRNAPAGPGRRSQQGYCTTAGWGNRSKLLVLSF